MPRSTEGSLSELSIIIPTYNAAYCLPATLDALGPQASIIISDGGSEDKTIEIAKARRLRLVESQIGRGHQIAAGCDVVKQGWMLILHADTRLNHEAKMAIAAFIGEQKNQDYAGYFRFKLDDHQEKAKRLERLVARRCRYFALPYGDQGLLVHKTLLDRIGGFLKIPIMEDVDVIWRLHKIRGKRALVELNGEAITSAEKFLKMGYMRRSAKNLMCLLLFRLHVPPKFISKIY